MKEKPSWANPLLEQSNLPSTRSHLYHIEIQYREQEVRFLNPHTGFLQRLTRGAKLVGAEFSEPIVVVLWTLLTSTGPDPSKHKKNLISLSAPEFASQT